VAETQTKDAQVGSLYGKITAEESQFFRRMRIINIWLFAAVFLAGFAAQKIPWMGWVFGILLAQCVVVTFLVTFWRCPRCEKLYGVRFSLFGGISWPWFNRCLHCEAELLKE
jgi:hypothetical protein